MVENNILDNANQSGSGISMIDASADVAGYNVTIRGNQVLNNYFAIYVQKHSTPMITGGNIISGNNYGIYIYGNNLLADNPNPVVTGNSIINNVVYNFFSYAYANAGSTILEATNNWWGTTDIPTIENTIYDNADSISSAIANISPILAAPPP